MGGGTSGAAGLRVLCVSGPAGKAAAAGFPGNVGCPRLAHGSMKPRPAVFVDRRLKQRVVQVRVYLGTLRLHLRAAGFRRGLVGVAAVEADAGRPSPSRAGF